jgi:hypothetical protein
MDDTIQVHQLQVDAVETPQFLAVLAATPSVCWGLLSPGGLVVLIGNRNLVQIGNRLAMQVYGRL